MSGPAMKPCRELSLMVAVRSGPGIRAPDSAITKDEAKIVTKVVNTAFLISFSYHLIGLYMHDRDEDATAKRKNNLKTSAV